MIEAKKLYAELAYLLPAQKREDLPQVQGPAFSRRAAAGRAQLRVFFSVNPKATTKKEPEDECLFVHCLNKRRWGLTS